MKSTIKPVTRKQARSPYQKKLDEVDIPAPTIWLHHDLNSTLHLLRTSQATFELGVPNELLERRREGRLKISKVDFDAMDKSTPYERRVIRGGRVLPWGIWPVRLRNLEGDTLYSTDHNETDDFNCVTEDSIHDELLKRRPRLPPSSIDNGTVRRLLRSKPGYWVDATPKALSVVAAHSDPPAHEISSPPQRDASGPVTDVDEAGAHQTMGSRRRSTTVADSSLTQPGANDNVVPKMRPGPYGGWVEVGSNNSRGKRKRGALVTPKTEFDLGPAAPEVKNEVSPRGEQRKGQPKGRARFANAMTSDRLNDEEEGHEEGSKRGWAVGEPAKEAVRRVWARATRRYRDVFVPTPHPHAPPPKAEARVRAASETGAKSQQNHGEAGGDNDENADWDEHAGSSRSGVEWRDSRQETAGYGPGASDPAADLGSSEGGLDPELLSLLSRECEGIIDATLHVVLSRELDRSRSSSKESAPNNPLLAATDWQSVLRTFWGYSTAVRRAEESKDGSDPPDDAGGGRIREVWGAGDLSDGAVMVVDEQLPALPLNEAVLTRSYNRMLLYLNEEKHWHA